MGPRPVPGTGLAGGIARPPPAGVVPPGAAAGNAGKRPAKVPPILPRVPPNPVPGGGPAGLGGPTGAAQSPSLQRQGSVAYSTELPAPLGLAEVQIAGLALALGAALVALRRPALLPARWSARRGASGGMAEGDDTGDSRHAAGRRSPRDRPEAEPPDATTAS